MTPDEYLELAQLRRASADSRATIHKLSEALKEANQELASLRYQADTLRPLFEAMFAHAQKMAALANDQKEMLQTAALYGAVPFAMNNAGRAA